MSGATSIEWTDATWSPVRGCSRVSEGCRNCYAERQAARFRGDDDPFHGFAYSDKAGPHWTGRVELVPSALDWPLRWRGSKAAKAEGRPSRIFVNSMSDLFHERLSDGQIAAVFGIMASAPQHTFQVLTKRAERMRRWFEWVSRAGRGLLPPWYCANRFPEQFPAGTMFSRTIGRALANHATHWPLPNVWLGVSVEDQETADERVPHLLKTPAAVRFVSYEPALKAVDFERFLSGSTGAGPEPLSADGKKPAQATGGSGANPRDGAGAEHFPALHQRRGLCHSGLDWLIVGGESGPGARPFDIAWARSTVEQCREAGVPVFVKQMGRVVHGSPVGFMVDRYILADGSEWVPPIVGFDRQRFEGDNANSIVGFKTFHPKGGDWKQWPEDLRVREFPCPA